MTSIAQSLQNARTALADNGVAESERESVSLLALALKRDRAFLYAHPSYELSPDELRVFESFIKRRSSREPFQYIAGVQEFYGLEFEVTHDVLIPRPETEMVVEHAIELLPEGDDIRFCEVGVGSGCIAVSILYERPETTAVGVDVSTAALKIAARNAARHGVSDRLRLIRSDVFDSLSGEMFHAIISNPPYVPSQDMGGLQAEVRDFEPHTALTDWADGLTIISRIVNESPRFLRSHGFLLMEVGFDQSSKVREMFDPVVWSEPEFFPDLQGIPRLVHARLQA
jgi:release factor glutamine methyltransferase